MGLAMVPGSPTQSSSETPTPQAPSDEDPFAGVEPANSQFVEVVVAKCRKVRIDAVIRHVVHMTSSLFPYNGWQPELQQAVVNHMKECLQDEGWIGIAIDSILMPMRPTWDEGRAVRALCFIAFFQGILRPLVTATLDSFPAIDGSLEDLVGPGVLAPSAPTVTIPQPAVGAFPCQYCGKPLKTRHGRIQHEKWCPNLNRLDKKDPETSGPIPTLSLSAMHYAEVPVGQAATDRQSHQVS
jgi:hypothetical protein